MKILKRILIVLAVLIAIPLIIAIFVQKEYSVQREIVINKPEPEVFDYIKNLRNQQYYNKWSMMDPEMEQEFRGTDGTIGFVYAWDSEEAGKGEQTIVGIQENERIDLEIHFIEPFEGYAKTPFTTEAVSGNQTLVTWGMSGRSKYPFNFMNLFIDDMLGKDLDTSLNNLKEVLEQQRNG